MEDNLRELFNQLALEDCEIRRTILTHRLHSLRKEKVIYRNVLTNEVGYISNVAGDVAYVIQCNVVQVSMRDTKTCSLNLPIIYKGRHRYLNTADSVITTVADTVPCNTLAPTTFFVNDRWISKSPKVLPALIPTSVHPKISTHNFSFTNNIINKGLYSSESLENYTRFLTHFSRKKMAIDGIVDRFGNYRLNEESTYDRVMTYLTDKWDKKRSNVKINLFRIIGSYMGLIMGSIYIINISLNFIKCHMYAKTMNNSNKTQIMAATWDPLTHIVRRLQIAERNLIENQEKNIHDTPNNIKSDTSQESQDTTKHIQNNSMKTTQNTPQEDITIEIPTEMSEKAAQ